MSSGGGIRGKGYDLVLRFLLYSTTPYSMNSLFSELFTKFGRVFLEVCETISRGIWEVFGGIIEDNYPEQKNEKLIFGSIKYYLE